jgi:hypothetical protein
MSEERKHSKLYLQHIKVQKLIKQGLQAFDVFNKTGDRTGLRAFLDQAKTFEQELKEDDGK